MRSNPPLGSFFQVETWCDFRLPAERIWRGITDARMALPKPLCIHLGIPLPRSCEITVSVDGVGKTRRCTSDKGTIEQEITEFVPHRPLAFRLVTHDLTISFAIGAMEDRFTFTQVDPDVIRLTRVPRIAIPIGCGYALCRLAIRRSLTQVHRYVYRNIHRP